MQDKQAIRESVWRRIDGDAALRRLPGARGRIPNFNGAEAAAGQLIQTPEWRAARVIKCNPDTPQHALRQAAVEAGKRLYMAVPKLTLETPFFELERSRIRVPAAEAVSIAGAHEHGRLVRLEEVEPIDLIVCGSVAVNPEGVRIGKGGGYADLEFALLAELGLVSEKTVIATSVHDVQVIVGDLPETSHDFRVDRIATPTRLLACPRRPRPQGILWDELGSEKIAAIPLLAARRAQRRPI
jgi:5-formyltetrahydrofolate cyclo-ligase